MREFEIKMNCPNCDQSLAFEATDWWLETECPTCKQRIELSPAHKKKGDGLKTALRWIAVVPAAVAGFGLALGVFVLGWSADPGLHIQIASFCLCPVAFVWSGASVAPAHRFVTAITLTILLSITFAVLFTAGVMRGSYGDWFGTGWTGASAILGIVCAMGMSFSIQRNELLQKRIIEKRDQETLIRIKPNP
jgi:hypothetical protein